jgi:RNA polymerase sigma-70 factor, ECF subfamily
MANNYVELQDLDELAQCWLAGDRSAFEAIVSATECELRAFAISRARTISDAEEAIQSAYIVAFENMADYRKAGALLSWLKGIARNRLMELRREHLRTKYDDLDLACDQAWEDQVAAIGEDGLGIRLRALQGCLNSLDERTRRILERHHLDGIQLNELAQHFRRPRQVMAKLLFTVRGRLRDCIEHQVKDWCIHV